MPGSRRKLTSIPRKPASSFLARPTAAQQRLLDAQRKRLIKRGHIFQGKDKKFYLTEKGKAFLRKHLRLDTF